MAVYTEVSFEELEGLLAGYDIGEPLSFKGIAEGVENSNFYLQTDRGAFILTLYEKRVQAGRPALLPGADGASGRARASPAPCRCATRDGAAMVHAQRPRRRDPHLPQRHFAAPARSRALRRGRRARWPACTRPAQALRSTRANALGLAGWRPLAEATRARADAVEDGWRR